MYANLPTPFPYVFKSISYCLSEPDRLELGFRSWVCRTLPHGHVSARSTRSHRLFTALTWLRSCAQGMGVSPDPLILNCFLYCTSLSVLSTRAAMGNRRPRASRSVRVAGPAARRRDDQDGGSSRKTFQSNVLRTGAMARAQAKATEEDARILSSKILFVHDTTHTFTPYRS